MTAVPAATLLHPAAVRTGWCPVCRAWSVTCARMALLDPTGVADAGLWAWCETELTDAARFHDAPCYAC